MWIGLPGNECDRLPLWHAFASEITFLCCCPELCVSCAVPIVAISTLDNFKEKAVAVKARIELKIFPAGVVAIIEDVAGPELVNERVIQPKSGL